MGAGPSGPPRLELPQKGSLQLTADETIRHKREDTRAWLAKGLVLLLAVVSVLLIAGRAAHWFSLEAAKDLALAVLSPLVAVTGTALGFYFGGEKDN